MSGSLLGDPVPVDPTPVDPVDPAPTDPAPIDNPVDPTPSPVEFPDGLDDEIKNDPSLKVFIQDNKLNMGNVLKSYVHAQKQLGKDKVILPGEHASEEDMNNFWNKIGRPDLEKYEVNMKNAEGEQDQELLSGFKELAHKSGLLPKQAQSLMDWFQESSENIGKTIAEKDEAEYNTQLEGLKKEWGEGFDREVKMAQHALREFASEEEIAYLNETGLANDITLTKLFNKIGKGLSEESFKKESHGSFGLTQSDAQAKINNMYADASGPYLNDRHPNHANAVQEMQKLQQILNG
jgi:hypothetical protein